MTNKIKKLIEEYKRKIEIQDILIEELKDSLVLLRKKKVSTKSVFMASISFKRSSERVKRQAYVHALQDFKSLLD